MVISTAPLFAHGEQRSIGDSDIINKRKGGENMEVSTIMTSSVQMQQVFSEITPDNEAGNPQSTPQSTPQQSMSFSELFDQCAGTGNGIRKSTDPFAALELSKAIAPSMQASRQLPGQQAPDSGLIPTEFAAGFLQGASPGERSLTVTMVESESENVPDVYTQALDANEPPAVPARADFPWALPFVPGNSLVDMDAAQPLPEPWAMVFSPAEVTATPVIAEGTEARAEAPALWAQNSGLERKQASPQPGNPEKTAQGAAFPVSAGKVLLQESQVKVAQQAEPSIITPEPLVKLASEVTQGRNLAHSAALSGPEVSATTPESGVPSSPSFFRETSLYSIISQGAEAKPEGDAVIQGKSLQPGTTVTIAQPEAKSHAGAEIPLPMVQGEYADALEVPGRKTVADPATALETPLPGENRRGGETAVNAYRAVTSEAVSQGKKGAALLHGDIRPSTPSAIPEAEAANAGEAPRLIDIVLTEKGKALTKGAGGEAAGKAEEVKSAGIETQPAFVQARGELRTNGEAKIVSPANDAKSPFPGQIHQQVREKLESGDYGVNKGNITLKLHPVELGELKINLRMEDQRLKIEIMTENPSVKEALMQNLDTLKETLSRQNIAMERFNVSTDLRQGFQQGARDERQLTQGDSGSNAAFQPATADEELALQKFLYGWDNDNSLVSLVL
jgi:flagellar hook-length control protein FliK